MLWFIMSLYKLYIAVICNYDKCQILSRSTKQHQHDKVTKPRSVYFKHEHITSVIYPANVVNANQISL